MATHSSVLILSSLALTLGLAACGQYNVSYRSSGTSGADAAEANRVSVNFTLPDRSTDPNAVKNMNGYYYSLQGQGTTCPSGEGFEEVAAYEDKKVIYLHLNPLCDYAVTLKFGALADTTALAPSAPLGLDTPINYEKDIKDLVAKNCVSCHTNFAEYSELVAQGDLILQRLEAGSMPQTGPLPDADIAVFLAWKDGGYIEKDTTPVPTAKELGLKSVYYRNDHNDQVLTYDIAGRIKYELQRTLWLQSDGQAEGFTVKEFLSYNTAPASSTATPTETTTAP